MLLGGEMNGFGARPWVAVFLFAASLSTEAASPCRPLNIQGDPAQCACAPSSWRSLREELKRSPEIPDVASLNAVMHAWLCEDGPKAAARLRRHMPLRLVRFSSGTGQDDSTEWFSRDELRPLGGEAWSPRVQVVSERQVDLSFAPNEACIAGGRFAHKGGGWLLVSLSEGCD